MVTLITNRIQQYNADILCKNADFELSIEDNLDNFNHWWKTYKGPIQLDTETNIVVGVYGWKGYLKGINKDFHEILDENGQRIPQKRECYVVQIGDMEGERQWLFDIPEANEDMFESLHMVFVSRREKLIHNGLFDYTTIKWCFGVDIDRIRDTYLISLILNTGLKVGEDLPKGYHSLSGCVERYLKSDISKAEQTGFTGNILTLDQIKYAALDVTVLGEIYIKMMAEIEEEQLNNVVDLECALIRSYGDGMCENLYLNTEEWTKTMEFQKSEVLRIRSEFEEILKDNIENFINVSLAKYTDSVQYKHSEEDQKVNKAVYEMVKDFVQQQDKYDFHWSSPKIKKILIRTLFPSISEDAKVKDYQNFIKSKNADETFEDFSTLKILEAILNKNYTTAERYFIRHYPQLLIDLGIYTPKGTVSLNLNSPAQKLALFLCIDPNIESTNKEVIAKINHPLATKLKEYNKAAKMATSYGENFLKAVSGDSMMRITGFQQILNTGRSSMDKFQLLPSDSLYRNPFKPNHPKTGVREDGKRWVLVGCDYSSQEAVVAATFCNEEKLLTAIEKGCDFHSTCASLMFPDEWKKLGGDPEPKGKPEDKTLQKLRNSSKTTSFNRRL